MVVLMEMIAVERELGSGQSDIMTTEKRYKVLKCNATYYYRRSSESRRLEMRKKCLKFFKPYP